MQIIPQIIHSTHLFFPFSSCVLFAIVRKWEVNNNIRETTQCELLTISTRGD